ncbi:MAG TPA: hypothetical protein VFI31_22880 [Pirellulales bacterium]|nr:hypothetical protein [Pirellulales bacterium]
MPTDELDDDVRALQASLDELAEALLALVNDSNTPDLMRGKFRKLARGAVTRSAKLPALARQDRAWLRRTRQFAGAVSRVLLDYLNLESEE